MNEIRHRKRKSQNWFSKKNRNLKLHKRHGKKWQNQIKNKVFTEKNKFINLVEKIETLSPINTLHRGYAILYTEKNKVLSDVNSVQVGEKISAHLTNGSIVCIVEKKIDWDLFSQKTKGMILLPLTT